MSADPDALLAEARTPDGLALSELARELPGGAEVQHGEAPGRIMGVQHDSRRVEPGDLFVVRRGASFDGSAFVSDAVSRGAVAVLAERGVELPANVPVLRVDRASTALAYASAAVYGHPSFFLDVVGITGTNGKTTTAHLVRAAVDGALGRPYCGVVGTVGHSFAGTTIPAAHTTPEADELARVLAVMKKRGATHVAMEVSSIALVLERVAAVRFRVAAFTNLTQDHLEFHGSMEAYAAAKLVLFTELGPGLAVVNLSDPFGERVAREARCKVLRVRTEEGAADADIAPERIATSASKTTLVVRTPEGRVELETRLLGRHNVENLLVTLGIVSALELDVTRAAAALAEEPGAPGRLERCDAEEDDVVVLVDYAHTPDALARVLDAARAARGEGRLACVFGCGGDRDPTKREPMGEAAGARADIAVVTSDNPRTERPEAIAEPVIRGVAGAGLPRVEPGELGLVDRGYVVELDRERAIHLAIANARPGDVVLVCGKGHEDYQIVGTEKRPFDDRAVARAALARRRQARRAAKDTR
jgi:UDP-N-acetylmuramoyl-L-alanyl-D-glutamate--2,6-diaminopimelate ligase